MTIRDSGSSLAGGSVFVSGGSGSIGSATAEALAADGAAVLIMGRNEESLLRTASQINDRLGRDAVTAHPGDARDSSAVRDAVGAACDLTGKLVGAVSVVGGVTDAARFVPLLALEESVLTDVLAFNVVTAHSVIRHATPLLVSTGGGSIVCISSTAAKVPMPYLAAYNAGKAGLEGLIRTAALELAPLNVRVNAIRPASVAIANSALYADGGKPDPQLLKSKPLGRIATGFDIAGGVRYLIGPNATYVTGQSIGVEGGQELRQSPDFESMARRLHGDELIDAALAGRSSVPDRR